MTDRFTSDVIAAGLDSAAIEMFDVLRKAAMSTTEIIAEGLRLPMVRLFATRMHQPKLLGLTIPGEMGL